MKDKIDENTILRGDSDYKQWLASIKSKIQKSQIKAAVQINTEMLKFYWELGADIVEKQTKAKYGDGLLSQLSKNLTAEFPDIKGFSLRNVKYVKQWYLFYNQEVIIGQQVVAQITAVPWGHNIAIITKCKTIDEALYYVQNTITHNWSRVVLIHQIESNLYQREGKAITNFHQTLPKPQSDLAVQVLKDPYSFDFLQLTKEYTERDIERSLVEHITKFLIELGAGFAYVGRQVPLNVGDREFFLDLLFYHLKLRAYIVIELKDVEFEPEHAGKLNFYLKAVDNTIKQEVDNPTIGLIICKKKNKLVAEYALSDIGKPIGISEYQLTQFLPDSLKSSLPTIEEIEKELSDLKAHE